MTEFLAQAREMLYQARAEVQLLRADYIGSEHLLLGLMQEGADNPVAHILQGSGVSLAQARAAIAPMSEHPAMFACFTPEARRIIHLSFDEASKRQQPSVAVEHICLALTLFAESKAMVVLQQLGLNLEELRSQILQALPPDNTRVESLPAKIGIHQARDKFTQRARRTLYRAEVEALLVEQGIDIEHLLLGLLYEREGVAFQVMQGLEVDLFALEQCLVQFLSQRDQAAPNLMPRAKRAVELSVKEAFRFGHHYLGTEHLLLGILSVCAESSASGGLFTRLGLSARRDDGDQTSSLFTHFDLTLKRVRKQTSLVLATGLRDDSGPF